MKVRLSDYDEAWSRLFQEEADFLMTIFKGEIINIEHFGSTAVPGLMAKPVIDMICIVNQIDRVDRFNDTMLSLGYDVAGEWGIPGEDCFARAESIEPIIFTFTNQAIRI